MGTMVVAAPLLAAGPPGWAIYGLIGVVTVVGAVVVYRAAHDADTTFPDTAPTPVVPCPEPEKKPEPTPPTVDPIPPVPDDSPPKRNCSTEHPDIILCFNLPDFYMYSSTQAAFRVLRDQNQGQTLRMEKTRPAESGPCEGTGTHTSVRSGGAYIASIVCCPCCTDTAGGPSLSTKCGIV